MQGDYRGLLYVLLYSDTESEKNYVKLRLSKLKAYTGRDSRRLPPQYSALTFPLPCRVQYNIKRKVSYVM